MTINVSTQTISFIHAAMHAATHEASRKFKDAQARYRGAVVNQDDRWAWTCSVIALYRRRMISDYISYRKQRAALNETLNNTFI